MADTELELIDRAYKAYRATNLLLQPEALALIAPFANELILSAEKRLFIERSRQMASRRRRRLWLQVGVLLLLVGLAVGGVLGMQWYRSLKVEKAKAVGVGVLSIGLEPDSRELSIYETIELNSQLSQLRWSNIGELHIPYPSENA